MNEFDLKEQSLDVHERSIRDYVLANSKQTEHKIAMAMQEAGICHRLTALKKIGVLKERGIIQDIKVKQNNFSCLVVRDTNEYSSMFSELKKIESLIDSVDKIMNIIYQIKEVEMSDEDRYGLAELRLSFLYPFNDTVRTILQVLLMRVSNRIKSTTDLQFLNTKIIRLMLRLTLQFYNLTKPKDLLNHDINQIKLAKQSKNVMNFAKKRHLDIRIFDDTTERIKNFEIVFLNKETDISSYLS